MKNFICYLVRKTSWENTVLFTLIFPLPLYLRDQNACWVDLPDWQYGELNEGCKSWIRVVSTGQDATHSAETPGPWVGMDCWEREPKLMFSVVGDSPQTLTVPWSWSGCLSSSLAQGPWQKIWSDLTCDWYQASAKNVLCWKGHSSLVPLDTNIWGPSLPGGIKWADKLLTYQFKPNLWEWKAAWEPNELALKIQISWELTRSGPQQA